jgi:oligoendopeptidase F
LEKIILFWPYMAVVDAFQHWAYTHIDQAVDPANCDRQWGELWSRFMGSEDWSGLEDARVTGWHRKLHIFRYPFYNVEYGMAQLGAVQIWANALQDQAQAVALYHSALKLGKTVTLPELFQAAGVRFAFDSAILREAVSLLESQLEKLV